jgi:hypothetical protein
MPGQATSNGEHSESNSLRSVTNTALRVVWNDERHSTLQNSLLAPVSRVGRCFGVRGCLLQLILSTNGRRVLKPSAGSIGIRRAGRTSCKTNMRTKFPVRAPPHIHLAVQRVCLCFSYRDVNETAAYGAFSLLSKPPGDVPCHLIDLSC